MALFKIYRGLAGDLPIGLHDGYAYFTTDDGKFYIDTAEKRTLINPLSSVQDFVHSKTTAEWAEVEVTTIAQKDHIYVYTDYQQDEQGNNIPGIKIGSGSLWLVDTPFIDTAILEHIHNTEIHVTAAEKQFWNNKHRGIYSANDPHTLILTPN